jgi:hypothetical protein
MQNKFYPLKKMYNFKSFDEEPIINFKIIQKTVYSYGSHKLVLKKKKKNF